MAFYLIIGNRDAIDPSQEWPADYRFLVVILLRIQLAMQSSRTPSSSSLHNGLAWLRDMFNRLAALWSTPRVGRVAICSPLVGVIAGLGAVGFLLSLQFMYSVVLGGLLHFHMPPTSEDKPHAITYPSPWWLVIAGSGRGRT